MSFISVRWRASAIALRCTFQKYCNAMQPIALLISDNYDASIRRAKNFIEEHSLFQPIFIKKGYSLEKIIWTKANQWQQLTAVIPKLVWDYFDRPNEFNNFLSQIERCKTPMVNSCKVVRWNMHKGYLLECEQKGFPILKMQLFKEKSGFDFTQLKDYFPETSKLVIKPSISGGSKNTAVLARHEEQKIQSLAETILRDCDLVIQPFYPEVQAGEYSFFFFGNKYSHSIIKVPAQGDFRAHSYFGSQVEGYLASAAEITEAQTFLQAAPESIAYARVDLLKIKNRFHLVELELIEPYLYLQYSKNMQKSAELFVNSILSHLGI